jgi:hypothetical protein
MGFTLVPLLLVVELSLEGMSDRLCRPLHKCLTEELRTLQAPMHPRLLPAAFGDRVNPGILLQFSSGGIAFPLFAKGDEEAGSKDWPSTWEGLEEGEVGMALGALCGGSIEVGNGLQGDAQLGHPCLDQQGIGSDDALIGGQRRGALDGLEALRDDICRAPVVSAEKGLKGGTARELGGFQGRPATQKVTEQVGVFVLKPLQQRCTCWTPARMSLLCRTGWDTLISRTLWCTSLHHRHPRCPDTAAVCQSSCGLNRPWCPSSPQVLALSGTLTHRLSLIEKVSYPAASTRRSRALVRARR